MQYRILGKTNLKVSIVGFGGIPVQRVTKEEAKLVIEKAEDLHINFIDTARGYGVSEEFIGEALKGKRERWIIASKSMARDYESMAQDVQISLKNLQTDYIDLYQFHNIRKKEDYDKILGQDGAYKALEEAKNKGQILHIGISSHSLDILKLAIESGKFETIMYPYNIVENQGEEVFRRARELNIGVIAMKPMAGGALSNGSLAMKYILQNQCVTTAIPGMATIEEVVENAATGKETPLLSVEEKQQALDMAKELGSEFCRRCGYCAPCKKGIDIPSMFIFEGYKKRYGLAAWAEDRYLKLNPRAKDCIQCGICEERCPYDLPIRKMLEGVRSSFNE